MKKFLTEIFLFLSFVSFAQIDINTRWTWMKGDNTVDNQGLYGTKGTAASTNKPGGRENFVSWRDTSGNLWLFGGLGYSADFSRGFLSDLWKYTPTTNQWTWVNGTDDIRSVMVYGMQGVPAVSNTPGKRSFSTAWTDAMGKFWLFGGAFNDGTSESGAFNDLWKYDPSTNLWTWVKGDNTRTYYGRYGVQGIAAPANNPGAREGAVSWTDTSGNMWLFGGSGTAAVTTGTLNDLWKYNPLTNLWTWVKGDTTVNTYGVYGILGTATAANKPGARKSAVSWMDASGNLWLFGGTGYAAVGTSGSTYLTHFAANQTVMAVVVGFHFFCVPICVLQIFFW